MKGVNEYGGNEKVLVTITICYETAAAQHALTFGAQGSTAG